MIQQYLRERLTLPINGLTKSIDLELKKWQKIKDPEERTRATNQIEGMIKNLYEQKNAPK